MTTATRPSSSRCYTITDVCARLQMSRRDFYRKWKAGALPMLEEILPRIGARPRFRADLVDLYLENRYQSDGRPLRYFGAARRRRPA